MERLMSYVEKMFGYTGRTVVLTGGGGVLAGGMAEAFLQAGARVSLWDIDQKAVDEAKARLAKATGAADRIDGAVVDAMTEASVEIAVAATERRFGGFDVLVNTAGGNRGKTPFVETDMAQFEFVLKLNLVAGLMVPTKVACKFAPRGIRVNALAPGFFVGKQNRALLIDEKTGELTARGKDVVGRTPFGRFGDASELNGAALYLASNEAAGFVTGVCIPVDGGFLVDCI
jgi:NAD(P)-dependent dehydrogenase (short-subunit alcohol dehydrogenase family)